MSRSYWVAPNSLRRPFLEPLQGGSVKTIGLLKPWGPPLSAGLSSVSTTYACHAIPAQPGRRETTG